MELAGYERLLRYLDEHDVPYEVRRHPARYTMQEIAAEAHLPGRMVAKVVIVEAAAGMVMLVLPACSRLSLPRLHELLGGGEVQLAHEGRFAPLFPDCETGAMPPFGNLYGMPVYVDHDLTREDAITCQAGTHAHTLRIKYADFERLVHPTVVSFADAPLGR